MIKLGTFKKFKSSVSYPSAESGVWSAEYNVYYSLDIWDQDPYTNSQKGESENLLIKWKEHAGEKKGNKVMLCANQESNNSSVNSLICL